MARFEIRKPSGNLYQVVMQTDDLAEAIQEFKFGGGLSIHVSHMGNECGCKKSTFVTKGEAQMFADFLHIQGDAFKNAFQNSIRYSVYRCEAGRYHLTSEVRKNKPDYKNLVRNKHLFMVQRKKELLSRLSRA